MGVWGLLRVSGTNQVPFLAAGKFRLRGVPKGGGPSVRPPSPNAPGAREFAESLVGLAQIRDSLAVAGKTVRTPGGFNPGVASSTSAIGITDEATPTTLRSTEEVNTVATSYSTHEPSFAGTSTSSPLINGVYDGSNGDTTLTFTATSGGSPGLVPATIEVRDGQGGLVDTINTGLSGPGTVYTISNGLEVEFSGGLITTGDSFQVVVSATVGSAVDPDGAFDGVGDAGPELDPGERVVQGGFRVNGEIIRTYDDDTLNAVLDRITQSAAGVTATFDALTERVVLTQDTPGPGETITITNDTSGFVDAVKLDGAAPVAGSPDQTAQAIDQVAELSLVRSGTLSVNGVQMSIDVSVDSLDDVLDRINSSGAGVTAEYDAETGRVTVTGNGSNSVKLGDGTSRFFSGVGVLEGTYAGEQRSAQTRFRDPKGVTGDLVELVQAYESLFAEAFEGFGSGAVESLQGELAAAVGAAFAGAFGSEGSETVRTGLGLDLVNDGSGRRRLEVDTNALVRAGRSDTEALADLLFAESGKDGFDGLVTAFERQVQAAFRALDPLLEREDGVGLGIDLSA